MTPDEIKQAVVEALSKIAPEIQPGAIDSKTNVRDQFDIDSMDFLNFVLALHARLGVDVPETDYPRLYTVDDAVAYLVAKTGTAPARGSSKSGA